MKNLRDDAFAPEVLHRTPRRASALDRDEREDASSRPGTPAHQTPPWAVTLIQWLREQHGLPAWAIGYALKIPRSTVTVWLRRLGLNRPRIAPAVPIQRYEWPRPGDMIHVDIKPLGRIGCVGQRIHGDRRRASRGLGWEYVHVAVDSRLAYVEVLGDQLGPSCAAFLIRAVAWFRARGIRVRRFSRRCPSRAATVAFLKLGSKIARPASRASTHERLGVIRCSPC